MRKNAETVTGGIFRCRTSKRPLVEIEGSGNSEIIGEYREETENSTRLKLIEVTVFVTFARALLDLDAFLNVMFADLCNRHPRQPHPMTRRMKMADGTEMG